MRWNVSKTCRSAPTACSCESTPVRCAKPACSASTSASIHCNPRASPPSPGGGKLHKVLDGLAAARQAGLHPIKINMVVMKDVNDDEIEDMVQFCIEQDFTLRLIETMPMGDTGRSASNHYVSLDGVRRRLAERFELVPTVMPGGGPARYVSVAGTNLRIGFITPISQHFCAGCNRVRLSADGVIYLCLGQEDRMELRPLLRQGIGDEKLKNAIRTAIARKPEKHDFREQPRKIVRFMSLTGG